MRLAVIALACLATPALAQADLAPRLAAGCLDKGWQVAVQSPVLVECRYLDGMRDKESGMALLGALGGRRSYSTFEGVVRFTIVEIDGVSRVAISDQVIETMAFGRTQARPGEQGKAAADILAKAQS